MNLRWTELVLVAYCCPLYAIIKALGFVERPIKQV
jgi:hypothetical protein